MCALRRFASAKESGVGGGRRFGAGAGRALGEHPTLGGAISVRDGRFGAYVNHGKVNATLPKGTDAASLTMEGALAALAEKANGGGGGGRLLGEHPRGGPISVRPGRFGAYVNWGKVNATIPKSTAPDEIGLGEAIDLIEEREGRPGGGRGKPAAKTKAPAKKKAKAKPVAKKKAPVTVAAKKVAAKGKR